MATVSHALTYLDLEQRRETSDERMELIEGEIFVTPSPTPFHQLVVMRLGAVLNSAITDSGLGVAMPAPLDVFFERHSVLQPDLVILVGDRAEMFERGTIDGPPSLVMEVLSPSTQGRDRGIKRNLYARHMVPEYWMIDVETKTVTIFSDPVDGRYESESTTHDVATSVTIPSLTVDLGLLFSAPRRFRADASP